MAPQFFCKTSDSSLLKEDSRGRLILFDSPLTNLILKNIEFHKRCLSRKEEGKEKLKAKLEEARVTFFSKEDMANWLCKIQADIKTESDRIFVRFEASLGSDEAKIDFEQVGYLLGMDDAAEDYLTTLTAPEPVGKNKAHFSVYDSLEQLD